MMEETNAETYKAFAGKVNSIPYHVPVRDGEPGYDEDLLDQAIDRLEPYIDVWDIETLEDPETTV